MADPGIVNRMVADGWDTDAARAAVDSVVRSTIDQLAAGKAVRLDGVGMLKAPNKRVWVPGFRGKKAREQRKIELRNGVIIAKGPEYAL